MSCRNSHRTRTRSAFSLIEIMVVIVIIGLLAGVLAVNVRAHYAQASTSTAKLQLSKLVDQIELYRSTNGGKYPTAAQGLSVLTETSPKTGEALMSPSELRDPWNNPFVYLVPGKEGQPFEIISLGADGVEGGTGENSDLSNIDLEK